MSGIVIRENGLREHLKWKMHVKLIFRIVKNHEKL